ncbi:cellulose synthase/poly-beta-1,6-N-acetylglucosamine synthase-like glycosyltransferase [Rhodococcus sp. OK519]|uniref:glycosyltransferase n=1 Tax=Rhodococcus sp. OK519 TaxID=2135729 RepID=UPI000D4E4BF2|nr:cellulose synthase/poly-beta-1,6-N-acetylglucosamine synthase-like glycosyltransferase [Rhodococcus sp. OK519]
MTSGPAAVPRRTSVAWWLTVSGAILASASAALSIGNALSMPRLRRPVIGPTYERVVVCVPARDEETTLPLLIGDLRAQRYPGEIRMFVLDDGSRDKTLAAAHRAAGGDPQITVRSNAVPPPPGWTGKAAACRQLADLAFAESPSADVIAFVDADVRLSPDAIAASVAALRGGDAALLCPWPEQYAGSIAERLLQPLLSFSWMSTVVVAAANRSLRPALAVACGQFLMFDAAAYHRIGGHAAVASSATEDLDIARALRRDGAHTALVSGAGFVGCRMYRNGAELRMGYTRWLWSSFGGRAGAAAVLVFAAVAYLLPPVAAVLGSGRVRRAGAVGYFAGVVARLGSAAAETAGRPGGLSGIGGPARRITSAGAHPLAVTIFAGLVVDSHIRRARNALSWKGRPLHRPTHEPSARRAQKRKKRGTLMSILDGAA